MGTTGLEYMGMSFHQQALMKNSEQPYPLLAAVMGQGTLVSGLNRSTTNLHTTVRLCTCHVHEKAR